MSSRKNVMGVLGMPELLRVAVPAGFSPGLPRNSDQ